jgi:voltage-gated potassium channel
MSVVRGHPPVLFGEGVELFFVPVPASLAGKPLRDTGIGSRTGLSVVALRQGDALNSTLTSETVFPADAELLLLGSQGQRDTFESLYGAPARRP